MANTLYDTVFSFPGQVSHYRGKVRDIYNIGNRLLVMVVSDRVSAFDVLMPVPIPYKGQVLNTLATMFLDRTEDIVPNWKLSTPDPNVMVGLICEPIKLEFVIRGYLSGHAWREYASGKRMICGVAMPDGMKENDKFPQPIITPATKADSGHDIDISKKQIIERGILVSSIYEKLESYTRKLFERGTEIAAGRGLILVDTKYEFGVYKDEIRLIDEIHTPDSSRYFYEEGYEERQKSGHPQKQLSKEFLRQWLISQGFQGLEGQVLPDFDDAIVDEVSARYLELFENLSGKAFKKPESEDIENRISKNVSAYLKTEKVL